MQTAMYGYGRWRPWSRSGRVLTPVCSLPPFRLCVASPVLDQLCHHILQLLAQEYGNDGRRCLVGAQTVIVSHIGCGLTQQVCMLIHRLQDTGQYQQELDVLMGCLARIQQVDAVVRGQMDQLLCLPEPLTPAKGFSCSRQCQAVTGMPPFSGSP